VTTSWLGRGTSAGYRQALEGGTRGENQWFPHASANKVSEAKGAPAAISRHGGCKPSSGTMSRRGYAVWYDRLAWLYRAPTSNAAIAQAEHETAEVIWRVRRTVCEDPNQLIYFFPDEPEVDVDHLSRLSSQLALFGKLADTLSLAFLFTLWQERLVGVIM